MARNLDCSENCRSLHFANQAVPDMQAPRVVTEKGTSARTFPALFVGRVGPVLALIFDQKTFATAAAASVGNGGLDLLRFLTYFLRC